LFEAVADAAEAAADEAHEGAGHAGEEDEEGEGCCCFYWGMREGCELGNGDDG
jgi:hypothetical protein